MKRWTAIIILPNGYEQRVISTVRGGKSFSDFRNEQAAIYAAKKYTLPDGFILTVPAEPGN